MIQKTFRRFAMNKSNIFDRVMNFIDENIREDYSKIKEGIYAETNYTDMQISKFMSILSNGEYTLYDYYTRRRAFFASRELVDNPEKSIAEIAQDFNYSDQTALNRILKKQYNHTPKEIRKNRLIFDDNKLDFSSFDTSAIKFGKRLQNAIDGMTKDDVFSEEDYFFDFVRATDEFGFDTSTCLAISEVSERIGIPFAYLLNICFDAMIDYKSSDNYIDPRIEMAIECDISLDEMDKICEDLGCEYYNLSPEFVRAYKEGRIIR